MTSLIFFSTDLFHEAGAPPEVFPSSSWVGAMAKVPPQMDIHGQFGCCPHLGNATTCVATQTGIQEEFQQINHEWLLKPCTDNVILPDSPHCYILHTLAEKYQVLTRANLGIGALAMVQWVMGMSDSGNPAFSKPVVLVLGPLVAHAQEGASISYDLTELGLSYHHPAHPLGKVWLSKHMYPLLSPMFCNMQLCGADSLLQLWTTDTGPPSTSLTMVSMHTAPLL